MNKTYYLTPKLEIIEIETEDAILSVSTDPAGGSVEDFENGATWGSF